MNHNLYFRTGASEDRLIRFAGNTPEAPKEPTAAPEVPKSTPEAVKNKIEVVENAEKEVKTAEEDIAKQGAKIHILKAVSPKEMRRLLHNADLKAAQDHVGKIVVDGTTMTIQRTQEPLKAIYYPPLNVKLPDNPTPNVGLPNRPIYGIKRPDLQMPNKPHISRKIPDLRMPYRPEIPLSSIEKTVKNNPTKAKEVTKEKADVRDFSYEVELQERLDQMEGYAGTNVFRVGTTNEYVLENNDDAIKNKLVNYARSRGMNPRNVNGNLQVTITGHEQRLGFVGSDMSKAEKDQKRTPSGKESASKTSDVRDFSYEVELQERLDQMEGYAGTNVFRVGTTNEYVLENNDDAIKNKLANYARSRGMNPRNVNGNLQVTITGHEQGRGFFGSGGEVKNEKTEVKPSPEKEGEDGAGNTLVALKRTEMPQEPVESASEKPAIPENISTLTNARIAAEAACNTGGVPSERLEKYDTLITALDGEIQARDATGEKSPELEGLRTRGLEFVRVRNQVLLQYLHGRLEEIMARERSEVKRYEQAKQNRTAFEYVTQGMSGLSPYQEEISVSEQAIHSAERVRDKILSRAEALLSKTELSEADIQELQRITANVSENIALLNQKKGTHDIWDTQQDMITGSRDVSIMIITAPASFVGGAPAAGLAGAMRAGAYMGAKMTVLNSGAVNADEVQSGNKTIGEGIGDTAIDTTIGAVSGAAVGGAFNRIGAGVSRVLKGKTVTPPPVSAKPQAPRARATPKAAPGKAPPVSKSKPPPRPKAAPNAAGTDAPRESAKAALEDIVKNKITKAFGGKPHGEFTSEFLMQRANLTASEMQAAKEAGILARGKGGHWVFVESRASAGPMPGARANPKAEAPKAKASTEAPKNNPRQEAPKTEQPKAQRSAEKPKDTRTPIQARMDAMIRQMQRTTDPVAKRQMAIKINELGKYDALKKQFDQATDPLKRSELAKDLHVLWKKIYPHKVAPAGGAQGAKTGPRPEASKSNPRQEGPKTEQSKGQRSSENPQSKTSNGARAEGQKSSQPNKQKTENPNQQQGKGPEAKKETPKSDPKSGKGSQEKRADAPPDARTKPTGAPNAPKKFDPINQAANPKMTLREFLNMKPNATSEDINRRARDLSLKLHPDISGDLSNNINALTNKRINQAILDRSKLIDHTLNPDTLVSSLGISI